MSDGDPIPWKEAASAASAFTKLIQDVTPVYLAGSLLRRKSEVGDIEIVVRPSNHAALMTRLGTLVIDGVCQKAMYSNGTPRWGDRYVGLMFREMRVEVFITTPDNFGYIHWLRTGPADGNAYVMKQLSSWPVRFDEGYARLATYENGLTHLGSRLRVPDVETMFKLLGMEMLKPWERTEAAYARFLKRQRPSQEFLNSLVIVDTTPVQVRLF
jgi:DNA polymerase/3'-5' exonuclease PolX